MWGVCDVAEKKLMEKVVRNYAHSQSKYAGPVCPISIAYPPTARVALRFLLHVAERKMVRWGTWIYVSMVCLFVWKLWWDQFKSLGGWLLKVFWLRHRARSICSFVKTPPALHIIRLLWRMSRWTEFMRTCEDIRPTTQWRPTGEAIYYNQRLTVWKIYVPFHGATRWIPCSINSIVQFMTYKWLDEKLW